MPPTACNCASGVLQSTSFDFDKVICGAGLISTTAVKDLLCLQVEFVIDTWYVVLTDGNIVVLAAVLFVVVSTGDQLYLSPPDAERTIESPKQIVAVAGLTLNT